HLKSIVLFQNTHELTAFLRPVNNSSDALFQLHLFCRPLGSLAKKEIPLFFFGFVSIRHLFFKNSGKIFFLNWLQKEVLNLKAETLSGILKVIISRKNDHS